MQCSSSKRPLCSPMQRPAESFRAVTVPCRLRHCPSCTPTLSSTHLQHQRFDRRYARYDAQRSIKHAAVVHGVVM